MMWCEQKLLVNRFPLEKGEIPLAVQSLCSGFSTGELDLLESSSSVDVIKRVPTCAVKAILPMHCFSFSRGKLP